MLTDSQREALAMRLRRGRVDLADEIPRRPAGLTDLPLSHGQEQLWFIDRFAPGLPTYNIPHALRLCGPLDATALGRALAGVVSRHEALRTRLVTGPDGRPVQVIDAAGPVPLERLDLSGAGAGERGHALSALIDVESVRPFSLEQGPLLRAHLVRLAAAEHVLLVVIHHVVFDGWSAGVLVRELAALYGHEAAAEPPGLAELPVQFADYALWERERLSGQVLAELEAYWLSVLDGFETIEFPADRRRPVLDDFTGALAVRLTSPDLLGGLRELARREGTTLFVALLAGLLALLHRYTGQTDLIVGTASANRSRGELAPLIGFLVNTLPIRADLSGDPMFSELLARVREATTGAYAHQDLPFARLVETMRVERDPSRPPLFQIGLTYAERDPVPVLAGGVEFTMTDLVVGINAAKIDLSFLAEARRDGLWFECTYKTALFDAGTVERLLGNLEVLLAGAVAHPGARLSELPVLTPAELRRELVEWNDTAGVLPVECIHQGFEAQVSRTPDAIAAQYQDERLTYAELNARANQIARRLRGAGVAPEALVGVCVQPGLNRLAALLGIWKAGGGYVPLDAALPADRLAFLVADTAMPVIVTDAPGAGAVSGATGTPGASAAIVISLDAEQHDLAALDEANLADTGAAPSNVAYVIYTSGSTGEPKGVVVEHRQAINFLHGMTRAWSIGPGSAILAFAAYTFDVSVMDMFMPLLAGARVVLAPPAVLHSPPRLAGLIRSARITFACLPPAVLTLLTGEQFPELRTLLSAGEELSTELLQAWLRPGLEIYNGYGPTEASIGATFMKLDGTVPLPPPIGRPKPNYRVYVLDAPLHPVPVGVTGELHIGGPGVARGYLNRPELTRERFIPDPFASGQRLYKTGDLTRRRPDGTIAFVGRIDNQVKIRGLRVELGEIESALVAHPAIAQAVVTVLTDSAGERQLAGYYRPGAAPPTAAGLRQHLAARLPAYLIPSYLMPIDQVPLTANGKIDKQALPAPAAGAPAEPTAPATILETVLVDLQLITALRTSLAVDLDVATVFLAPTPQRLAGLLRDKHAFEDADLTEADLDGADLERASMADPGTEGRDDGL